MDLLLKNSDPVDAGEPAMFLDVAHAVLEVAEPLAEVRLQQVPYQIFHVGTEVRRKPNLHRPLHCNCVSRLPRNHHVRYIRHLANADITAPYTGPTINYTRLFIVYINSKAQQ